MQLATFNVADKILHLETDGLHVAIPQVFPEEILNLCRCQARVEDTET